MGVNCGLAVIEVTDSQGLIVGAIFIAALIGTILWACISEVKKRKKQLLEEYIEEQIQARKDILEFRKEENFKHKEQNIELNKKALALRAYNQQILEEH